MSRFGAAQVGRDEDRAHTLQNALEPLKRLPDLAFQSVVWREPSTRPQFPFLTVDAMTSVISSGNNL